MTADRLLPRPVPRSAGAHRDRDHPRGLPLDPARDHRVRAGVAEKEKERRPEPSRPFRPGRHGAATRVSGGGRSPVPELSNNRDNSALWERSCSAIIRGRSARVTVPTPSCTPERFQSDTARCRSASRLRRRARSRMPLGPQRRAGLELPALSRDAVAVEIGEKRHILGHDPLDTYPVRLPLQIREVPHVLDEREAPVRRLA